MGKIFNSENRRKYFNAWKPLPIYSTCDPPKAPSTVAGMPVGHYQLSKFSLTSEAVFPDNHIVLAPHFRSCLPLPFPPCVLERVMGTVCPSGTPDRLDRP